MKQEGMRSNSGLKNNRLETIKPASCFPDLLTGYQETMSNNSMSKISA